MGSTRGLLVLASLAASMGPGCARPVDDREDAGSFAERYACKPERTPIDDPDGELADGLSWIEQPYAIDGRYGVPEMVAFSPSDAPVDGELVIEWPSRELSRPDACGSEIEASVDIALRTNDGALDERFEGTVIITSWAPGNAAPNGAQFRPAEVELRGVLDPARSSGDLGWPSGSAWAYESAFLHARLSAIGSRGEVIATPVRSGGSAGDAERDAGARATTPLLYWPTASCGAYATASTLSNGDVHKAFEADLARVGRTLIPARYVGTTIPSEVGTDVTITLDPPGVVCSSLGVPTGVTSRAHVRTADGRIDVVLDALVSESTVTSPPEGALDLVSIPSLVHGFDSVEINASAPRAYAPAALADHVGRIDVDWSGVEYASVSLHIAFDGTEAVTGALSVFGYDAGECWQCNGDHCAACYVPVPAPRFSLEMGSAPSSAP